MDELQNERRKLTRSRSDRYVAGICGGLADYFEADSNLIRVILVVGTLIGGLGLVLYIAGMVIIPENDSPEEGPRVPTNNNYLFWGVVFIAIGGFLLLRNLDLFDFFYFPDIDLTFLFALALIGVGGVLLYDQWQKKNAAESVELGLEENDLASDNKAENAFQNAFGDITRSRSNRMLAGICGGLSEYFKIDASIVRLIAVVIIFSTKGIGVLIYFVLMFVLPEENPPEQAL